MTRYNDEPAAGGEGTETIEGYQEGVERVFEYITSINAYPKLVAELAWAIRTGVI